MNDPLTFAEKQRLHDKFLLARRNAPGPPNPNADKLAGEDFRDALKRWAAGEELEIPPPVKRRPRNPLPHSPRNDGGGAGLE